MSDEPPVRIPYFDRLKLVTERELERQLRDAPRFNAEWLLRAILTEMDRLGMDTPLSEKRVGRVAATTRDVLPKDIVFVIEGPWRECVMVVGSVNPWGITAYSNAPNGAAHTRLEWGQFRRTGGTLG